MTDVQWLSLLRALDLEDLASDSRFADSDARALNRSPLEALLAPRFQARPVKELFDLLDGLGVPCEIADGEFCLGIFDDPEMQSRELVVHQQHPKLGEFDHFGRTIYFSDTPGRIWGPPPLCGQHTREILHEYGYDDADIDKLVGVKAVFEELWVD